MRQATVRRAVTAGILGILAAVVAVILIASGHFGTRGERRDSDGQGSDSPPAPSVLAAMATIQKRELWDDPDLEWDVVAAFKTVRKARDPRTAGALAAVIDYAAPGDPNVPGGSGYHPPRWECSPAVPALIQLGEDAIPAIVSRIAEGFQQRLHPFVSPPHLLVMALGAIKGPQGTVEILRKAIDDEEDPTKRERLRLALEQFRKTSSIPVWIPEGQGGQPYCGPLRSVLEGQTNQGR